MTSFESSTLGLWGGESEDIIKRDFPIHRACRDGDLDALRSAWAVASRDRLTAEDKFYGWTPIHWAAYFGKLQCLEALLAFGVAANLTTTKFRQTPCHIAAFGGHPQCLLRLLRAGANFHAQDYLGETPIHKAARVGNLESIGVLLGNGSRVNLCNNNGHTPCDLARMQGFQECVRLLESSASRFTEQNRGSSGQIAGNFNGNFNQDMNGNHRSRKRMMHDDSIPNFKRGRHEFSNGPAHSNGEYPPAPQEDTTMEMDDASSTANRYSPSSIGEEVYDRHPSPGMDMNLNADFDMQLWGHQNGYGDTAETMPSPNAPSLKHRQALNYETGYDRPTCAYLRGLQSRGWH